MIQNTQTVDDHEIKQIRDGALKFNIISTIYIIWSDRIKLTHQNFVQFKHGQNIFAILKRGT